MKTNLKRLLAYLLSTCFFFSTFIGTQPIAYAAPVSGDKTITGSIALPGEALATQNIDIDVMAFNDNGTQNNGWDDIYQGTHCVIPSGQNSVSYTIMIPDGCQVSEFAVKYRMNPLANYIQEGYYRAEGTTFRQSTAGRVDVSVGSPTDINLTILTGYMISGTLSRPEGANTDAPIEVEINANDEGADPFNGMDDMNFGYRVIIPGGAEYTSYELAVPSGNYKLRYWMYQTLEGYIREGFYNVTGTTHNRGNASNVPVIDSGVGEKNLTLIAGDIIYGTISMPEGYVAAASGSPIDVFVSNDNGTPQDWSDDTNFGNTVMISGDNNTASYSVTIPKGNDGDKYSVGYRNFHVAGCLQEGYYHPDGTVAGRDNAGGLDAVGGSREGINLTILKSVTISGSIGRPEASSSETITVHINAVDEGNPNTGDDNLSFGTSVALPAGVTAADYTLEVAPGNYKLSYSVGEETNGFLREGFYSDNGTKIYYHEATPIPVDNTSITDKDLMMIPGRAISGTVYLPDGEVAPAGGLQLDVHARFDNNNDDMSDDYSAGVWVNIQAGTNSGSYYITVPDNAMQRLYTITYNMHTSSSYLTNGFYNSTGTVARQSESQLVDVSLENQSGVNLTLLKGYTISGTISRPATASTAAPIPVDINAIDEGTDAEDGMDDLNYWDNVVIPAGSPSVNYEVTVPSGSYRVRYWMNIPAEGYIREGYLGLTETTSNKSNSIKVDVPSDNTTENDLTLLMGKFISGTISLPGGAVAPAGGLPVNVNVWSNNGTEDGNDDISTGVGVTIPEGYNSAPYSVTVPEDTSVPLYTVRYHIESSTGYLNDGYYSNSGIVFNENTATRVDVSSGSRSGINLAIPGGYKLIGIISRPAGVSTASPISLQLNASDQGASENDGNDDKNFWTNITIPANEPSVVYELPVAPGNYKVRYWLNQGAEGYVREGYFGSTGTILRREYATTVRVVDQNITGISFSMIPGRAITGTITLPNSDTAPTGGLQMNISARSDNGTKEDWSDDYSTMSWVTIPEGDRSALYTVTVPFDISSAEYKVNYRIESNSSYLREGYYTTEGTMSRQDNADSVSVSLDNATGIDLNVLTGYVISGTVSRPSGADTTAPITVEISANDYGLDPNNGNDDLNFGTRVTIPADQMTANYEFVVAEGNYSLRYWQNQATNGYIREGFYTANGTTPFKNPDSVLPVPGDNTTDLALTLIPGSPITGTISLPNGDTAPAGGIELEVRAWSDCGTENGSDDFNTFMWVNIPAGENSADYSLMILDDVTLTYRLSINTPSNSVYTAPAETEFTAEAGVYNTPINLVLNKSQLSGRIVSPVGEDISYGYVEIRETNGDWIPGVGTDQSGNFTIGGLADGSYILRAFKWDSNFTSSMEVRITISQGMYVPDPGNDPLTLSLTLPQITGTVYTAPDVPVNGGNVELRDQNGMWISNTNIRSDGTFSFGGLSVGNYVIKAYPYWETTDYTPSKDVPVSVEENANNTLVVMLTVPQIRGTVMDADGNPANQGWVEIYNKMTGMGMPGASIKNGNYSFGGLSDGVYVLRARPEAGTALTASAESEIVITNEELSSGDIDLVLTKSQLEGAIYDPFGENTEYGWVEIRKENGDWIPGSPANRNGLFSIGGLEDGKYILKAYPNGGVRYTASQETLITITDGTATPATLGIFLTLPQISGLLVTPDGTPLNSGHVEIRKQNGEWINGVGADYDGYFAIGGLPEGTYYIKAYPGGNTEYCASDEFEITIVEGQPLKDIVIAMNSPQFSGSVMNPDGTPAFYGNVDVYNSDGRWVTGSSVDQNGFFSVGSLKDGTYEIKAYPDWRMNYCASEPLIISIQDGVYNGSSVTLQLTRPLASGTVMNPSGTGSVRYGWIDVKNYDTDEWQNGYSVNEDGRFNIGNLADGTYVLRAMADQNSPYANSEEMIVKVIGGVLFNQNEIEISDLEILLTEPKINGRIVAPDGVSETSFGWVEARTVDGRWVAGGNVDFNGNFRLGKLGPAGTYILKAYPNSYDEYTASIDITVVIDEYGTVISAEPDVLLNGMLTIRLSEVQLKGIVTNSDGEPALYGWVEVQKDMGNNNWEWINCFGFDWNGGFKLGGLADGTYRLRAFPDQRDASVSASVYYTITIVDGLVVGCDVTDAYASETNTITLKLSVPQLTGRIIGPSGEAVSYGWVEVRNQNNEFVTGIGAGKNGEFAISGLEANQTYKVVAYPSMESGFTESEELTITTDDNGTCSGNPVALQLSSIQVTGHVTTPDGQPVSRGWVEIYLNDVWVASSGIDENGTYKFGGLADGQYSIRAFAEPGTAYANSQKGSFEITGGDVAEGAILELALTTPQTTGTVYLPGGMTNAYEGWVEIGDASENWFMSVPIANDGTFKLPAGISDGTYTIQAFPAAGSAYGSSNVLTFTIDGNPNTLTLILK